MAGVNKVIIIGNVGKDPEIRQMQDGFKIANFSIATSESWKDKNTGERKEKTEWHRIAVMNERLSEIVEKYVRKGSKLYVEGQLQTRKWTDQSGMDRYTTEVVLGRFKGEITMLDSRNSGGSSDDGYSQSQPQQSSEPSMPASIDDEMPF